MKKNFAFLVLSILITPVFAETGTSQYGQYLPSESIEQSNFSVPAKVSEKTSNPKTKFPHGLQLGVGASVTSGLSGFVGYANKNFDSFWLKRFGVRLDFGTTSPLKSVIDSGIDSVIGDEGIELGDDLKIKDADIKGQHFAALLDFYPFGNTWFLGGLRISGGYYFGDLDISANLTGSIQDLPDAEYAFELSGIEYKYIGNEVYGTAWAEWNYRGPYLGAGFDLGLFAGLKIYMDAGVVFTNKTAQLGLDLPTENLQKWDNGQWKPVDLSGVSEFEQAKAAALSDAQDELDKLKFYPMVKIGFMYRF